VLPGDGGRHCAGIEDVASHLPQAGVRAQPSRGADEGRDVVPGSERRLDDAPPERPSGAEDQDVNDSSP